MPTRDQLIEQLRKLRRLADDVAGTPEGAAATRKVRELMKRYGISASEVTPRPTTKPSPWTKGAKVSSPVPPFHAGVEGKAVGPATITLKIGNVRIRWKL